MPEKNGGPGQRGSRWQGSSMPRGIDTLIGSIANHFQDGNMHITKKEFRALARDNLQSSSSTGAVDDLWRALFNEGVLRNGPSGSQATFSPEHANTLLLRCQLPAPGPLLRSLRRRALLRAQRESRSAQDTSTSIESHPEPSLAIDMSPMQEETSPEGDGADEDTEEPSIDRRTLAINDRVTRLRSEKADLELLRAEAEREIDEINRELAALEAEISPLTVSDEPQRAGGIDRPWEDMGMTEDEYTNFVADFRT